MLSVAYDGTNENIQPMINPNNDSFSRITNRSSTFPYAKDPPIAIDLETITPDRRRPISPGHPSHTNHLFIEFSKEEVSFNATG